MNFLPGQLERRRQRADRARRGAAAGPACGRALERRRPPRELILGIRPEHFEDAALVGDKPGATFDAPIDIVESMGSDVYAYFTMTGRGGALQRPRRPGQGHRQRPARRGHPDDRAAGRVLDGSSGARRLGSGTTPRRCRSSTPTAGRTWSPATSTEAVRAAPSTAGRAALTGGRAGDRRRRAFRPSPSGCPPGSGRRQGRTPPSYQRVAASTRLSDLPSANISRAAQASIISANHGYCCGSLSTSVRPAVRPTGTRCSNSLRSSWSDKSEWACTSSGSTKRPHQPHVRPRSSSSPSARNTETR